VVADGKYSYFTLLVVWAFGLFAGQILFDGFKSVFNLAISFEIISQ